MPDQQQLADGHTIPALALGVWQIPDGRTCYDAVRWALELGYRHIDTAQAYGNEESVGRALADSGLAREEVFVATKFHPGHKDPVAEMEASLKRLNLEYVDLYIVHWPQGGAAWMWPAMEQTQSLGFTRSIGISNFSVKEIEEVLAIANSKPVVNQIQLSPFESRRELIDEMHKHDLVAEAYSPLGTGRHLSDPTVQQIAERVGKAPSQVLIRWGLQHDFVVLAKSTHREYLEENAGALDFELSAADMAELDGLDESSIPGEARESKWWS